MALFWNLVWLFIYLFILRGERHYLFLEIRPEPFVYKAYPLVHTVMANSSCYFLDYTLWWKELQMQLQWLFETCLFGGLCGGGPWPQELIHAKHASHPLYYLSNPIPCTWFKIIQRCWRNRTVSRALALHVTDSFWSPYHLWLSESFTDSWGWSPE